MATRPFRHRRPARGRLRLLACRVLLAFAAVCFVAAFTVAALAPPGLSLGGGLQRLVGHPLPWPTRFDGPRIDAVRTGLGWQQVVLPFLMRPAWLLPVMLGFVSAGVAISLGRSLPGGTAR